MSKICKKCNYISLGTTNKYILLIFLEAIVFLLIYIIEGQSKFFSEENLHPVIYNIYYALGSSLSFILFIIYYIKNKGKDKKINYLLLEQNNKNEITWKQKFLWILLVSIIDFIGVMVDSIFWINAENYLNLWPFSVTFLSLFSYLILKSKLYKHHYICIIIIAIIGLLHNIIYDKLSIESIKNYYDIYLISIFNITLFCLEYVLNKYCMFIKYIKSYELLFFEGLIQLILATITLIITTNIGYIDNFWDFYYNLDKAEIIIFIGLILVNFMNNLLIFLIIDKFSPMHILLADFFHDLLNFFNMIDIIGPLMIAFSIVLLLIYIFVVLVYLELIELNFLGLSTMTKRNIQLRAQFEIEDNNKIILRRNMTIDDEYEIELKNFQDAEKKVGSEY